MSKISVEIDYIKMAQYKKCIEYYLDKISKELDRAIKEKKCPVSQKD